MKSIALKTFLEYRFFGGLCLSDEGKMIYRLSRMNEEKNRYEGDLWFLDEERHFLLANKVGSFAMWDGSRVLFSAKREEEENKEPHTELFTIDPKGGEALPFAVFPLTLQDLRRIDKEWFLVLGNREAKKFKHLPEEERKKALEDEKNYEVFDEIPFWANGVGITNKKRTRLFLYNIRTKDLVPVTDEYTEICGFDFSEKRREVLVNGLSFTDKAPLFTHIERINLDTLQVKEIGFKGDFAYRDVKYFGEEILFSGSDCKSGGVNQDDDIYLMDLNGENIRKISPEDWDVSLWNSVGSDVRYGGGKQTQVDGQFYYFMTTEGGSSYLNSINKEGTINRISKNEGSVDFFDVNNGKIVCCALREQKLQELYLIDGDEEKALTVQNKSLEEYEVKKPEEFSYSSQGDEFTGYVLLPKEYDAKKKYPGILAIHGGPKTVYGSVFYHEMQFFAAEGYVVFFTNPTGSDGLGRDRSDIRGKYGFIDYDNLMDFTDEVLKRYPAVNSDALGVMGGSYGGFMTNWIIGHTNRFAAAASQRSIANWVSKFGITDIGYFFVDDQQGATPWNGVDVLWEHSPLKYADQCKTPTLFIHSDEDYRCHLSCGLQMFTALKYHGVDSRLVLFHGENHELSRSGKPKGRVRRLREIYNWFEKYLKQN